VLRSWDLCFNSNGGGIFQVHLLILGFKFYVIGDWGGSHYQLGTIGPNWMVTKQFRLPSNNQNIWVVQNCKMVTTKQIEIIGKQDSLDYCMSIWFTWWLKNFNRHFKQLGQVAIEFFLLPWWIISLGGDRKKFITMEGNWIRWQLNFFNCHLE
jgi:hypothetical protein